MPFLADEHDSQPVIFSQLRKVFARRDPLPAKVHRVDRGVNRLFVVRRDDPVVEGLVALR